jgi:hypothetical protein
MRKGAMMGKIQYPPGGLIDKNVDFDSCIKFCNDPLYIEFVDNGYIAPTASGFFKPDLPTGTFAAGDQIGPYYPITDNTKLVVDYLDTKTNAFYRNTIYIKDSCP